MLDIIKRLSYVTRWSKMRCINEESVLEHTGFVAVYSLYLAYKYGADIGDTLERAVVHDLEEIETGDIPTPTKYSSPEMTECMDRFARISANKISIEAFNGKMYHPWQTAKDKSTKAGMIVSIADAAAIVYKIRQEVSLGNKEFLKYIDNSRVCLNKLIEADQFNFYHEINDLIESLDDIEAQS